MILQFNRNQRTEIKQKLHEAEKTSTYPDFLFVFENSCKFELVEKFENEPRMNKYARNEK